MNMKDMADLLSHEDADRILQNIFDACGMEHVPLDKAEQSLQKHLQRGKSPSAPVENIGGE